MYIKNVLEKKTAASSLDSRVYDEHLGPGLAENSRGVGWRPQRGVSKKRHFRNFR